MATSSVEFSFNDIMHRQIDGVAVGSPLRPALANIIVGHYETKLFQTIPNLKYITGIWMILLFGVFVVFNNENQCKVFLKNFNSLHPSLRFTMEKESHSFLP